MKDRQVVEDYYNKLKELGFESNEEVCGSPDIFARADDRFSLDAIQEEDERETATPLIRERGVSAEEIEIFKPSYE